MTIARSRILAILLTCLLSIGGISASKAQAENRFIRGVHLTNVIWLSVAEQTKILDELERFKIKDIRVAIVEPMDQAIDFVDRANKRGFSILAFTTLAGGAYHDRSAPIRPGLGRTHNVRKLSDVDVEKFKQKFGDVLKALDARNVRLVGIEIDNELNWGGFNGDLAVWPDPKANNLIEPEVDGKILQGFQKYVEILRITKDLIRASTINKATPLISAGLTNVPEPIARSLGIQIIEPTKLLAVLRKLGMDKYVDAYGMHTYFNAGNPTAENGRIRREMDALLAACDIQKGGKPCWITEAGSLLRSKTCAVSPLQAKEVQIMVDEMNQLRRAGKTLGALYWHDWTSKDYGLFQCDTMSPVGKTVLEPAAAR